MVQGQQIKRRDEPNQTHVRHMLYLGFFFFSRGVYLASAESCIYTTLLTPFQHEAVNRLWAEDAHIDLGGRTPQISWLHQSVNYWRQCLHLACDDDRNLVAVITKIVRISH